MFVKCREIWEYPYKICCLCVKCIVIFIIDDYWIICVSRTRLVCVHVGEIIQMKCTIMVLDWQCQWFQTFLSHIYKHQMKRFELTLQSDTYIIMLEASAHYQYLIFNLQIWVHNVCMNV